MPQNLYRLLLLFVIFLTSICGSSCSVEKDDHFLEDRAGILSTEERERISRYNKLLLTELDIHFKLLILEKKAHDINRLAADVFNTLGEETKGAKGLLFMATMSQVVRMNHRNMWMFKSMDHPFMFAFRDWSFDKNGFPIVQQ